MNSQMSDESALQSADCIYNVSVTSYIIPNNAYLNSVVYVFFAWKVTYLDRAINVYKRM